MLLLLLLGGCAGQLEPMRADGPGRVELDTVPFFPQRAYQCGPAALATLLSDRGIEVTPDDLVGEVYLPARQGSLQVEMVGAIRRRGLVPYRLSAGLDGLMAELDAGHPVLVLQNLGISILPSWHYAVVVGYDRDADALVLRSGTIERRIERRPIFLRTWRRSDDWAVLALPPGVLPAVSDPASAFLALAEMESVGQEAAAAAGYSAMVARWPQAPDGYFGLGNLALAHGDVRGAETLFGHAVALSAGVHIAARNNLAVALLARGCAQRALAEAEAALALTSDGDPLKAAVSETRDEALDALIEGSGRCD